LRAGDGELDLVDAEGEPPADGENEPPAKLGPIEAARLDERLAFELNPLVGDARLEHQIAASQDQTEYRVAVHREVVDWSADDGPGNEKRWLGPCEICVVRPERSG
jgi:hypothetical protein